FPSVAEMPDEPGIAEWYPFIPENTGEPGAIGMAEWLEQPAGKLGRIRRVDDALIYGGEPIKLWGLNLCYGACSPNHELADRRAAFYAKYGINSVRLHKFADGTGWAGIQSKESAAEYDPTGLERMDYQVAKFKDAGIYVALSAHFGTIKLGPADVRDVPFLAEFGEFNERNSRVSAPHSAFFYSPELQNLHIRQMVNLLKHRNPHTGLTYAQEPAVCAVEIINEQSIFFYTSMQPLKESATIRRQVGERFSNWLRRKYGDHEGLIRAWGEKALDGFEGEGFPAGEQLDKGNILPLGNPWYWDPAQLDGGQAYRRQRLLDTLRFLYELQCEAYDRYVAAVREAGYEGEILGSNWQAGRAFSHYANLLSDARVGMIDRHNYFGGNRGGIGPFAAGSMLSKAGSGSLSSGLQQVGDRPFMLSEWIHVFPNEWGVEGPAILGAYGMGLQGWDVSYLFQNGDDAAFSRQLGRQAWDVMAPQVLGILPAVARQVLRGDAREADLVAPRLVHAPSLFEGRLGFEDQVAQGYDDKELNSSQVPAQALAVARCTLDFREEWQETPGFDLTPWRQDGFLVSSTGQLRWREGNGSPTSGYFTMNTPGTKAVVGFAEGKACELGEVTITPQSRFAAIYVTAPGREQTIGNAKRLLVVAMARARNMGIKFNRAGDELLEKGRGPVLLEPVRSRLVFGHSRVAQVNVLDHDGRRTGRTLAAREGRVEIDGAREQTPYYEVVFE
ncbi:MAG: beta-galactosidase, partial [Verrucomicrobiae bacterium]|nr:beta-galactosidase [Verrucomicrobiae bacterium]